MWPVGTFEVRTFGDPVLRQRAADVDELDGDLARLADTMVATMYEAMGIGLAAPQIGVLKRMYTYDTGDGPATLINPRIVDSHGEWVYDEGCLSIPDLHLEIVRPKVVTVQGIDLDGKEVVFEGDELMGRLIQHEIDHLDGVLMLDRLDPDERKVALREMRRAQFDDAGAARVGARPDPGDSGRRL
jgi:peptide deformylase